MKASANKQLAVRPSSRLDLPLRTRFEMVEFKFHIYITMDAWRQMIRHRTASIGSRIDSLSHAA